MLVCGPAVVRYAHPVFVEFELQVEIQVEVQVQGAAQSGAWNFPPL